MDGAAAALAAIGAAVMAVSIQVVLVAVLVMIVIEVVVVDVVVVVPGVTAAGAQAYVEYSAAWLPAEHAAKQKQDKFFHATQSRTSHSGAFHRSYSASRTDTLVLTRCRGIAGQGK
jgi:hypothetical protein